MTRAISQAGMLSIGLVVALAGTRSAHAAPPLRQLKVPAGFHVALFSDAVPDAREMAVGPKGTVFVGSNKGKVFALTGIVSRLRGAKGIMLNGAIFFVLTAGLVLSFSRAVHTLGRSSPCGGLCPRRSFGCGCAR